MTSLQAAAKCHSARCLELLPKKRIRTGAKSKDGQSLIALEMALSSSRMDVIWNPDDYSVEDLVVLLSEKDLTTMKLLCDKTKAIGEVAYSVAMEGKNVALAALLTVAAEKVNDYVVVLRDTYSSSKEKEIVYQCVIRKALSSGRRDTSPSGTAKVESDMKRKVLLCEIELLQLFGADALDTCGDDKKLALPLIRTIKTCKNGVGYWKMESEQNKETRIGCERMSMEVFGLRPSMLSPRTNGGRHGTLSNRKTSGCGCISAPKHLLVV